MAIESPHPAFPLRFTNGSLDVVEQDSADHKAQRVNVVLHTTAGEREDDPMFGIPDNIFRVNGVDLDALKAAVVSSEPDVATTVERIDDLTDLLDTDTLAVLIAEDG